MKRSFMAVVACSLLLALLFGASGRVYASPDRTAVWNSTSDWKGGTYENARVHNGSVDIGIYPPEPDFSGSDWVFSTSTIDEVDDLEAKREGGEAKFYARDYSSFGEYGEAYGYATNTFYLDVAGLDGATLEFWWKAFSDDFDATGTTTFKILLQKPTGSWVELWSETKTTPWESTETNTESVNISASHLTQSGYYTIKIQAYWDFYQSSWDTNELFYWYIDDISFGLTRAKHTTPWRDIGATSAWENLEAGTSIGSGQTITAYVQVSDDGTTVRGTKSVSLLNGTRTYSISTLLDARYVRVVTYFWTSSEASTPRLDNYEVTADPLPTLSSGSVAPNSGEPNTTFTFSVNYRDPDGDVPSFVKVYIDDTGYDMTKITGEYTTGATFQFLVATLSTGSHYYYFEASDGTSTIRLPTSSTYSGPTVIPETPTEDTDGDGMPDTWESQYGLNPNINDADQDADGDGYTNLQEYQAETNPKSASSYPGATPNGTTPDGTPTSFPWAVIVVILIVIGVVGGAALVLKRGPSKPKSEIHIPRPEPPKPAPSKLVPAKPVSPSCPQCKLKLPTDSMFCPECGRELRR